MTSDIVINSDNYPVLRVLRNYRRTHQDSGSIEEIDYLLACLVMNWLDLDQVRVVSNSSLERNNGYSIGLTESPVIFVKRGEDYFVYGWPNYVFDAANSPVLELIHVDIITSHRRQPITPLTVSEFGYSFAVRCTNNLTKTRRWFDTLRQVNTILSWIPEKYLSDCNNLKRYVRVMRYLDERKKRNDSDYVPELDISLLEDFLQELSC